MKKACWLQGPAVIAEKLSYFIQTGQATQLMQQAGYRIGNIELNSFSPLPGVPAPAPGPLALGTAGTQSAAQAGKLLWNSLSTTHNTLSGLRFADVRRTCKSMYCCRICYLLHCFCHAGLCACLHTSASCLWQHVLLTMGRTLRDRGVMQALST